MHNKYPPLGATALFLSFCQNNPRVGDEIGTIICFIFGLGVLLLLLIPLITVRNSATYPPQSFSRIIGVIFLVLSGIGLVGLLFFVIMVGTDAATHNFWDLIFFNALIFIVPAWLFYYCISNWKAYKPPHQKNELYDNLIDDYDSDLHEKI